MTNISVSDIRNVMRLYAIAEQSLNDAMVCLLGSSPLVKYSLSACRDLIQERVGFREPVLQAINDIIRIRNIAVRDSWTLTPQDIEDVRLATYVVLGEIWE